MRENIEFDAPIEDGKIIVPPEFQDAVRTASHAHITLTFDDRSEHRADFLDRIQNNPIKLTSFEKLTREEMHAREALRKWDDRAKDS